MVRSQEDSHRACKDSANRSKATIIRKSSKTGEGVLRCCLLRCCLPGEYLSILLVFHASLGALVWGITAIKFPASLLMTIAGVWIAARAAGVFAQRRFTPFVTSVVLISLVLLQQHRLFSSHSALPLFSVPLFVVMIAIVFLLDIAELVVAAFDSNHER